MKTPNDEMDEAVSKWRKLTSMYTLVTAVQSELPPEVHERLDPWLKAMDTIREAAAAHNAVLAPQESDVMGSWLRTICDGALDEAAATFH